jgi:outer membrane protein TolC
MRLAWGWAGLALVGLCAHAQDYPDLPPAAAVERALAGHPAVRAAEAGVRAAEAERLRLAAGSYEFSLRAGAQQRRVDDPAQRFGEWDVGLERPLRLPAKARLDGEIGAQAVVQAEQAYGDARHEAARGLLRTWFAWQRGGAEAQQWQEQVRLLGEQLAVIEKRIRAGDAAPLDRYQAEAALAQAEAALAQARSRIAAAANALRLGFPGILLPAAPSPPSEPEPLEQGPEYWREQVLQHNHELALARAETQRGRLAAARSRAERTPDPTVALRYASERGGAENLIGVSILIPLPGEARSAAAAATQAEAEAGASREALVLARLEAEAANAWLAARAAYDNWQNLSRAAARMGSNADLVARAYALGEGSLAEALNARRLAIEARLAAAAARLEAAEARYRLLLDAHRLWPLHAADAAPAPQVTD